MKHFDYHSTRILVLLGTGPKARWEITQKIISHMNGEKRSKILDGLVNDGYLKCKSVRNLNGPGAPRLMYELTARGKKAYARVSRLDFAPTEEKSDA